MSVLFIENKVRAINLRQDKIKLTVSYPTTYSTKIDIIGRMSMRSKHFNSNDEVVSFLDGVETVLDQII